MYCINDGECILSEVHDCIIDDGECIGLLNETHDSRWILVIECVISLCFINYLKKSRELYMEKLIFSEKKIHML